MAKSVTTTGALYRKFYQDDSVWDPKPGHSWYLEEDEYTINGEKFYGGDETYGESFRNLPDDAKVVIQDGWLAWQGSGPCESNPSGSRSLTSVFSAWEKEQTVLTVVATLEIPRDMSAEDRDALRVALESLGAKKVVGLPEPDGSAPKAPKP